MFDKLRKAFSNTAKNLSRRELKEKDIEDSLLELEISLLDSDVASEVIDVIKEDLKERLIHSTVERSNVDSFIKNSLIRLISGMFDDAGAVDILAKIRAKKESPNPYIILFVGINGTGKTTTVAKIAHLLKSNKMSVAVAASDTFRAGAIEQIKEHMNRLHVKVIAQNYGADPAAVAKDAVLYARSHKVDCVLIDTAGRMQTSKNLMQQIAKITNVVRPDLTVFVGDSLAGNDTVNQAREFHTHVKFDASILTKSDADARGGAALSIVKVTSTPVIFVGIGQEHGDLKPFDKDVFLRTVFGSIDEAGLVAEAAAKPEGVLGDDARGLVSETVATDDLEPLDALEPEPALVTPETDDHKKGREADVPGTEPGESRPPAETEPGGVAPRSDPFEGIDTADIAAYSDLYDAAPPEDDRQASLLADRIKRWVSDGRPAPKLAESLKETEEKGKEVGEADAGEREAELRREYEGRSRKLSVREEDLDKKEASLDEREAELRREYEGRSRKLSVREEDLDKKEASLDEREAELRREYEGRSRKLNVREEDLDKKEASLDEREAELRREYEGRSRKLSVREEDLDKKEASLDEREAELRREYEGRSRKLSVREEDLDKKEASLDEREAELRREYEGRSRRRTRASTRRKRARRTSTRRKRASTSARPSSAGSTKGGAGS